MVVLPPVTLTKVHRCGCHEPSTFGHRFECSLGGYTTGFDWPWTEEIRKYHATHPHGKRVRDWPFSAALDESAIRPARTGATPDTSLRWMRSYAAEHYGYHRQAAQAFTPRTTDEINAFLAPVASIGKIHWWQRILNRLMA
jgi:hypothetical protein